jgi:hypothetical protein
MPSALPPRQDVYVADLQRFAKRAKETNKADACSRSLRSWIA